MPEKSLWLFRGATDDGKNVLIFDPGYESGDLHIYTQEKSVPGKEVQQKAEEELGQSYDPPYRGQDLGKLEFGETHGKRWKVQD